MYLIAHNIRSLHNVGAIFRSADAFGIERIYLTGFTGTPPRPEIAKVSLGAEDRVPWEKVVEVVEVMKVVQELGYVVVALENGVGAEPIARLSGKIALLLGNEVDGIEKDVLDCVDRIMEIPMRGRKRSLNVSVAAGIAMFALQQKFE